MKKRGIYIPSIEAKDIVLAQISDRSAVNETPVGYNLKLKNGEYNLRKFINTYDYSSDLIELLNVYYNTYRRNDFYFRVKKHLYTDNVINVTFKYSVKKWNQMGKGRFIKYGHEYKSVEFNDGVAISESGEIIGVQTGVEIKKPICDIEELTGCFEAVNVEVTRRIDGETTVEYQIQYAKIREPKTLISNADLRKLLYKDGFGCCGKKYRRMKRSAGSARVGKCLFIREELFEPMMKFSSGGVHFEPGQEIDLAAYEGYISLPSSSIIDVLPLKPENILVVDDYDSIFYDDVIVTYDKDGVMHTEERREEIINCIWDGQSLIDPSVMGIYSCFGMVLLRNLMFKSCCFNCNIQQWFRDNGITEVSQLNGKTRAVRIEDIKMITTPSSIKYLKFGSLDDWLDHLYPNFGIVKHDKKTHFFGGRMVQTHYQLINTLQMSKDEMSAFLKDSLDFAQKLRDDPAVVRHYIKYPDIDDMRPMSKKMLDKNDVVYNLMCINEEFTETKYYQDFLHDLLASYYKNLKNGHVYVNGNYSTLVGNPMEMLMHAVGKFDGESQIGIGNVHSTRFGYDKVILGSRSPHVTIGNVWLPINRENSQIDRYFNFTDEIVCINSIGENVLQRLSGCDFDSDTVLLTDNKHLISAAEKNYKIFKTPTSALSTVKVKRYYTPEDQADLDIKTAVNKIGEIINLSQELNSLLWDRMCRGLKYDDIKELYYDICQLDVMSCTEIDKAKKEFTIDNAKELNKIREKYKGELSDEYNKKKIPHFFAHIARQKGYYNPERKNYCKYNTSMDYLQSIVNGFRIKTPYKKDRKPFTAILDASKFRKSNVNQKQINRVYSMLKKYVTDRKHIFASELSKDDKFTSAEILYQNLVSDIESENFGFSTLYCMLSSLDSKENMQIKTILLKILYLCNNESFNRAVIQSADEIKCLVPGGNDIKLFGIGYKITKKRHNSASEVL